jgi:hypothetical protein
MIYLDIEVHRLAVNLDFLNAYGAMLNATYRHKLPSTLLSRWTLDLLGWRFWLPDMIELLAIRTYTEVDCMIVFLTVFLRPCPDMCRCFCPVPKSILHKARDEK